MKALIITLFLLAAAFLAYDFFLAPPDQRVVFEKGAVEPVSIPAPKREDEPAATAPRKAGETPALSPQAKGSPTPAADADGFVPPPTPTLEEATKNWMDIPERAFPRPVKIKVPVEVAMSAGSSTLAAGASVIAVAAREGYLAVSPTEGSTARGKVAVTDTDFPDQLRSTYDTWKQQRLELARKDWEASKAAGTLAVSGPSLDEAGKPVRNANGSYNLLLQSMHTRQVTEVRPNSILQWGTARPGQVDGKPGWLIDMTFEYNSIFGPMPAPIQAQIRDGKVVRWIFVGTGEEIP